MFGLFREALSVLLCMSITRFHYTMSACLEFRTRYGNTISSPCFIKVLFGINFGSLKLLSMTLYF